MFLMIFVILELFLVEHGSAYILLQVKKYDDHANVDAVIHKVVPNDAARKFLTRSNEKTDLVNMIQPVQGIRTKDSKIGGKDSLANIFKAMSQYVGVKPELRSQELNKLDPEIVHFRSDQPSIVYELNSNVIIHALSKLLSSPFMEKYVDNLTKGAAVVYRAFKDDVADAEIRRPKYNF